MKSTETIRIGEVDQPQNDVAKAGVDVPAGPDSVEECDKCVIVITAIQDKLLNSSDIFVDKACVSGIINKKHFNKNINILRLNMFVIIYWEISSIISYRHSVYYVH